jgi:hypothetical protein
MIRLHMVVEGQTEETFVNRLLAEHLGRFDLSVDVRRVETSRRRAKIYRGGLLHYRKVRKDISLWMKEDQNPDAYFSTMFDLYALPDDFPEFDLAAKFPTPYERVIALEDAFGRDIQHPRFIPYIQLHEFEALLFSDPSKFDWEFIDHDKEIRKLIEIANSFNTPELIDDNPQTAPSKRIIKEIPEYSGRKSSAGPIIAEKIGIQAMREKCVHFNDWVTRLESLDDRSLST